jgi:hypothetical protein
VIVIVAFVGVRTTSGVTVAAGVTVGVVVVVAVVLPELELLELEPPPPESGDGGLVAVKVVDRAVGLETTL